MGTRRMRIRIFRGRRKRRRRRRRRRTRTRRTRRTRKRNQIEYGKKRSEELAKSTKTAENSEKGQRDNITSVKNDLS